jgi:hypothetical protein
MKQKGLPLIRHRKWYVSDQPNMQLKQLFSFTRTGQPLSLSFFYETAALGRQRKYTLTSKSRLLSTL